MPTQRPLIANTDPGMSVRETCVNKTRRVHFSLHLCIAEFDICGLYTTRDNSILTGGNLHCSSSILKA